MKLINFILFFSIVFTIHFLVNFYIYKRLTSVLPDASLFRTVTVTVFYICALSFFVGRFLEKVYLSHLTDVLIWIGSFWFAYMLYLTLSLLLIDLLRLLNHFFSFFPGFMEENPLKVKQILGLTVFTLVSIVVLTGFINSRIITTKSLDLSLDKESEGIKQLKIVMFSDLHLGSIIGKNFASRVVQRVNSLNPDVILIPGDIVDEDIEPVLKNGICEELKKLRSKYGVYASTGNHEYIGNAEIAVKHLTEAGIKVIRDTVVFVDSSFYLLGREDLSRKQFTGLTRKPLTEIAREADKKYPIILMDHQPFNLHEAENNGVDLQLSGHTHHGQLWPLNYITQRVYELSWGYKKRGNTHYYVSCGVGGWGPPARLGSRPEIMEINLTFK